LSKVAGMMRAMSKPIASLILAERSVPRYTSYPTAPHFSASVDGKLAAHWLRELPGSASLSLYLHVPFCSAICNYCGCHTKAVRREEPLDAYTGDAAARDRDDRPRHAGAAVTDLHWGGGTPSLLGPSVCCARSSPRVSTCFDLSGRRTRHRARSAHGRR
jgi:oxygen-independent coproporphyrinogen-3 oxidase